jgi:hypothetical protein
MRRTRELAGVGGDPSGDLGSLASHRERGPADLFRVDGPTVDPYSAVEFAEDRSDQVLTAEHVVGQA